MNAYPREPHEWDTGPILTEAVETYLYQAAIPIVDRSSDPERFALINTSFTATPRLPVGSIFKATVVRARAVRPGELPSAVVAGTFFVHPEIASRFSLPVISVTSDASGLFDYDAGIYVAGKVAVDWRRANPSAGWNNGRPANYNQRGEAWGRAGNVEIFSPEGEVLLNQGVGLRIHGGYTRANAVKSLRLYARSRYDADDRFNAAVFPGLVRRGHPEQALESFNRLLLRNAGQDWNQSLYGDAFMQGLVSHLPIDGQAYQPALHFLNGEFWGLINIRERLDQSYLADHYGMDPDAAVILNTRFDDLGAMSVDNGTQADLDDFHAIVDYAEAHDLSDPEHFEWIRERVDLDNLALYYGIQIFLCNQDWPHNNNKPWRKRTPAYLPDAPTGHDGRWRWFLFDLDFGYGRMRGDHTTNALARVVDLPSGVYTVNRAAINPVNRLFRELVLSNEGFRHGFINTLADQMNTSFQSERSLAFLQETEARIAAYRPEHNDRWDLSTLQRSQMVTFAQERPTYQRNHLRSVFGLEADRDLTVSVVDGGLVRVNGLIIDETVIGLTDPGVPYPWSGTYFQDVPVELEALPEAGYQFVGWVVTPTGAVSGLSGEPEYHSTEPVIQYALTEDTTVEAVFEAVPLAALPIVLHAWDFEDADTLLLPSFTIGGGALTIDLGPATDPIDNTGGDFATRHLRVNNPLGSTLTWSLPTTGYEGITLDFLTRRSGQGAELMTVDYTTDGSTWTTADTLTIFNDSPQAQSFDFSAVAAINDNPDFALRFTFAQGDAGGTAGNNRFDDVVLMGTALPGTNLPPVLDETAVPPVLRGAAADGSFDVSLDGWFTDPEGDPLSYSASSSAEAVATVLVNGETLTVTPLAAGDTVITVGASDGTNPAIETSLRILVYPEPFALSAGTFSFTEWDALEPAGAFPANMLFVQSDVDDPQLTTPLDFAYAIPAADAANANDVDAPYNASSRSRINGLGTEGIAFINTGRGRDVGAAVVALDTTGVSDIRLSFTAGTVLPNSRIYGLRLQSRIGLEGAWTDVLDEGEPVEYLRNETPGHSQVFGPITLPASLEGQPQVFLRWFYNYKEGGSSRAQLRLGAISISPATAPTLYSHWILD
ncbi:MAG: hypothetical protein EA353_01295 [Puniceicoccaceae bacterium]|nr:MAG: hypothetical protein EA353_01295 [Puniceicoccaceae bacterium]